MSSPQTSQAPAGTVSSLRWPVAAQIGTAFLLALIAIGIVGVLVYNDTTSMVKAYDARRHSFSVIQQTERVLSVVKDAETGQRGYLITGEERYLDPYMHALLIINSEIDGLRELTGNQPDQQRRLAVLEKNVQDKINELKETVALRRTKGFDAALQVVLSDKGKAAMETIRNTAADIENEEQHLFADRLKEAEATARKTFLTIEWGIALSALALFLIGFSLARRIAKPLRDVTKVAEKITAGDLSLDLPPMKRSDEVGALGRAFSRMNRSLSLIADRAKKIADGDLTAQISPQSEKDVLGNAFSAMSSSLRALMQEISDAVNVLGASSREILASTSQLASSAAESATAVTETTATVEEVKQTSQVSSQKGKQVADSAQRATEVADSGRQAVEKTIDGMNRIREQMESIAASIVRLSEQSQTIGEIIAVVDDLAAQSNLLAVNASIEAAKAGEHGRGFAVVAQEVKNLADQSKQATSQVRAILNEIQKATSVAVLATEQGNKAVEAGAAQSQAAGAAIGTLNESIFEATQLATQIAATSQQQFVGMDQVALAMENIKSASTQTVASTRQAEDAAQNLHDLGKKLKGLVGQFKV